MMTTAPKQQHYHRRQQPDPYNAAGKTWRGSPATFGKPNSHMVWVPAVPKWEKDFCREVGQFEWRNFVEAKNNALSSLAVIRWDDSAARDAFFAAKNSYYARHRGGGADQATPQNPNLYIDEIVWEEPRGDGDGDDELLRYSDEEETDEECIAGKFCEIPVEEIKPVGWDPPAPRFAPGFDLEGMVIGPD
ncbi:uncharacterized protein LOC127259980 [Andrographis paniculata]|uniref:uncharacterized protein LOC127259980 n=1 Tax=Andrographis paniculata TaxID=175694 RepID=UPI0021E96F20|nr:uncharacterized protein LOC127259980 [Andrographis paniculata]